MVKECLRSNFSLVDLGDSLGMLHMMLTLIDYSATKHIVNSIRVMLKIVEWMQSDGKIRNRSVEEKRRVRIALDKCGIETMSELKDIKKDKIGRVM